ncbi:MAG: glycosyltransferase family protein [Deferrisomatales bacterium]
MKTAIVIQARVGSTRLPGKILRKAGGKTLLERCAARAARSRHADEVVIATTDRDRDDAVAAEARRLGLPCVRGSEEDVLSRYHRAAAARKLEVVCRVTSDCPLIDPEVIDALFDLFFTGGYDYASNTLRRTFPRGLDAEVFHARALGEAHGAARDPAEREHVTPFFYRNPQRFRCGGLEHAEDLSGHRWTVDEPADLAFVRAVLDRLDPEVRAADTFGYRDVLRVLRDHPELARINAHVRQKAA